MDWVSHERAVVRPQDCARTNIFVTKMNDAPLLGPDRSQIVGLAIRACGTLAIVTEICFRRSINHRQPPGTPRAEIDAINDRMYRDVNNTVYRAGFAITQEAYDEAVASLFKTLDWLEAKLSRSRYLPGDQLSEADIRLFTTLVRFDAVYHGHFIRSTHSLQQIHSAPDWSAGVPAAWR
jgi:glutathione S-transferase